MQVGDKKNILIVSTSFPRWENDFDGLFVLNLAKKLSDFFNIIVLTPHSPNTKTKEYLSGILVYRFKYFWPEKYQQICHGAGILPNIKDNKLLFFVLPFLFIGQFFKTIFLIKKEKIDLVHNHWLLPSGLISGLAAKVCRRPSVATVHGSDFHALKNGFWRFVNKKIINSADYITVVNSIIAQELSKINAKKSQNISIIPMGTNTSFFNSKTTGNDVGVENVSKPLLFFVGNLIRIKGLEYLINSLPEVLKKFPTATLVLVGEGQEQENLQRLANDLNIKNNVIFLGRIDNDKLPYWYNQADVFVLSSLNEGLPTVLLEAMSCGCPVVTTNVGGISSLIQHKQNGLLVNPGSTEELSQTIIKILSDNDLKQKITRNACQTVRENYDWQIIANKFKQVYNQLL